MKLGLGTVQFGMDYGVSNTSGRTSLEEAREILHLADESGLELIDTAFSYGDSETVLGKVLPEEHSFRIVTKTPVFKKDTILESDRSVLMEAFNLSLERLGQSTVYALLVHNADDLISVRGDILFSAMSELKMKGLVQKIGASVYTSGQIDFLTDNFDIDIIQLPINVLDRRLLRLGYLDKLKGRGIEIHARSVFLQGLLLMSPEDMPLFFEPVKPLLGRYQDFLRATGLTPVEAAFCFIRGIKEIDHVIVGVVSSGEMDANIKAFNVSCPDAFMDGLDDFNLHDPQYLNPAVWRLQ